MTRRDLTDFVACYRPTDRHNRTATWSPDNPEGRWRCYSYDDIINRDKASLDIFWLRDESLEDSANLPDPHILAGEIAKDLESALEQIREILGDLAERERASASSEVRKDLSRCQMISMNHWQISVSVYDATCTRHPQSLVVHHG